MRGFHTVSGVITYMKENHVDLCILDVMIGHDNGFDLLKEIKEYKDIPVIFVTARADEFDRIYGIEIGGDDYLTKPFSPRELVVRANRLLNRVKGNTNIENQNELYFDGIVVNRETMEVMDLGNLVSVTLKEYELLVYMMINKNRVLPREMIVEKVWGFDAFGQTRMVDDIVKRLRKKLSIEIETVWGVGYRLHEKAE